MTAWYPRRQRQVTNDLEFTATLGFSVQRWRTLSDRLVFGSVQQFAKARSKDVSVGVFVKRLLFLESKHFDNDEIELCPHLSCQI
jgi:hypothetical protein